MSANNREMTMERKFASNLAKASASTANGETVTIVFGTFACNQIEVCAEACELFERNYGFRPNVQSVGVVIL